MRAIQILKSFSNLANKKVHIPTNKEDDGDYEVERLLDHYWDPKTNSYYYLVKWTGYNELFESRWEPRAHLKKGAKAILKEYDDKNGIDRGFVSGFLISRRGRFEHK